jgi:hypothetical protein
MSLNIYENSGGISAISKDGTYTNPFSFFMSQEGGIMEQRFYLRAENPPEEAFEDGLIYATDSTAPDERFWIQFAPDVNGSAGVYADTYEFTVPLGQELPFWIKVNVPSGQEQGIKTDVKIQVSYVQVDA